MALYYFYLYIILILKMHKLLIISMYDIDKKKVKFLSKIQT